MNILICKSIFVHTEYCKIDDVNKTNVNTVVQFIFYFSFLFQTLNSAKSSNLTLMQIMQSLIISSNGKQTAISCHEILIWGSQWWEAQEDCYIERMWYLRALRQSGCSGPVAPTILKLLVSLCCLAKSDLTFSVHFNHDACGSASLPRCLQTGCSH